jgi:galactokinase
VYGLGFGGSDEGRLTLIEAAMKAENDMAGASTGGLDQNASMRCTPGRAILLDCRPELDALHSVTQEPFDLDALGLELLVLDTQAAHQLNDGQYEARRAMCEDAARLLGVANLRVVADEISHNVGLDRAVATSCAVSAPDCEKAVESADVALAEVLGHLPDETMKKRVRHVVTEIWRVPRFVAAFAAGDVKTAGALFDASHDSLATDYEVTVPELDVAVEIARVNGVYGARMTGGGFGGSIIALVDKGQGRRVAQSIADGFAAHGFHAPRALAAVASDSACRVA